MAAFHVMGRAVLLLLPGAWVLLYLYPEALDNLTEHAITNYSVLHPLRGRQKLEYVTSAPSVPVIDRSRIDEGWPEEWAGGLRNTVNAACRRFSETFPSVGECPLECKDPGLRRFTVSYRLEPHDMYPSFIATHQRAVDYLAEHGGITHQETHVDIGLLYLCCYSHQETEAIRTLLDNHEWGKHRVSVAFGEIGCSVDSWGADSGADVTSVALYLDKDSERAMQLLAHELEEHMRRANMRVVVPRELQQPFHVPIAQVPPDVPVEDVLRQLNEQIRPHEWLGGENATRLLLPRTPFIGRKPPVPMGWPGDTDVTALAVDL
ncbi:unnamed protein product [Vitrella brassicaformis CCMP3155]|uniref:Uncharacterized protein n=2 Tax=Vitrella brassicaformis TaxID=1169539 RepID=A0A0G4F9L9_VITBC|nr:unnamed protein product [Vitrella brassicaformis CCMP3155]|mmetsp:Transcript_34043/g.84174  ORF Transcript_34043/g.84174 Transcript_34043/m.84174 type:complete len:320 (+) Transcript_34043:241-1200(+)|eukprot:CEM08960.1 unnamed protein product [Vitrella brassicaformis CCMP3155]